MVLMAMSIPPNCALGTVKKKCFHVRGEVGPGGEVKADSTPSTASLVSSAPPRQTPPFVVVDCNGFAPFS